jgi:hypothetical protein
MKREVPLITELSFSYAWAWVAGILRSALILAVEPGFCVDIIAIGPGILDRVLFGPGVRRRVLFALESSTPRSALPRSRDSVLLRLYDLQNYLHSV